MYQTKAAILERTSTRVLVFAVLLGVSVAAPYLKNQLVTGSIVNATLFMAVATLGLREAIMIGLIPSLISISVGLLPIVLAPMIPFIMLGNATLVSVFDLFPKKNQKIGFIIAAVAKFAVIYGASFVVANLIKQPQFAQKAAVMMGYMQLVTVLIGAAIALSILNYKNLFASLKNLPVRSTR
jgi:hypothetical protein